MPWGFSIRMWEKVIPFFQVAELLAVSPELLVVTSLRLEGSYLMEERIKTSLEITWMGWMESSDSRGGS